MAQVDGAQDGKRELATGSKTTTQPEKPKRITQLMVAVKSSVDLQNTLYMAVSSFWISLGAEGIICEEEFVLLQLVATWS